MQPTMPDPVRQYFVSEAAGDDEGLRAVLADDVHVHDEGEDYRGPNEVVAWLQAARETYAATTTPLSVEQNGDDVAVRSRLEGKFPGSPVEVTFSFLLSDGLISRLAIG
jgi:ketosteroid isomerase-like protein